VPLGISPSYIKDWMPADGFREFYQNWHVLWRFRMNWRIGQSTGQGSFDGRFLSHANKRDLVPADRTFPLLLSRFSLFVEWHRIEPHLFVWPVTLGEI
jgi:hypothetical protein